jgi:hypothetical protein
MALPDPEREVRWRRAAAIGGEWFLSLAGGAALLLPRFMDLDAAQETRLLRTTLFLVAIFAAVMWGMLMRTRQQMAVMEDLLNDVRFGPGTKRDRDAVDILVRALRTSDAGVRETALRTLRKLSGLDLGDEALVWETWWSGARSTFTRVGGRPAGKGDAGERGGKS